MLFLNFSLFWIYFCSRHFFWNALLIWT